MKHSKILAFILVASLLAMSPAWRAPQDKKDIQAILVKVVRDVTKNASTTSGWQKAIPLDRLKSGYQVRTDAGSAAIIKFADETKIIVRQKSIVTITGKVQGKQILDRDVYTEKGNLQFNVKKQEKEQFRFSSPISVASIRGTEGAFVSDVDSSGMLVITEGLATYTNLLTNQSQDVGHGQTGRIQGKNFNVGNSSEDEKNLGSSNSNLTTGSGGGTSGSGTGGGTTGGGTGGGVSDQQKTKELIIYGEDVNGQQKKIIIKIQQ
ncbi:MAG: FecR domain-containing protein [Bacteroidota bacterium]